MTIRLELPNEQYIAGSQDLLDKGISFLKEVIYQPKVVKQSFDPTIVEREKQTLKNKIEALKEDKMNFANNRLIEEMCKDEAYRLRVHGYEEDLEAITAENLYAYYEEILKNDHLDVFVLGDINDLNVEKKVTDLVKSNRKQSSIQKEIAKVEPEEQTIVEEDDINQAKLHFGYRTNITYDDPEYAALHVFNGLYGGFLALNYL